MSTLLPSSFTTTDRPPVDTTRIMTTTTTPSHIALNQRIEVMFHNVFALLDPYFQHHEDIHAVIVPDTTLRKVKALLKRHFTHLSWLIKLVREQPHDIYVLTRHFVLQPPNSVDFFAYTSLQQLRSTVIAPITPPTIQKDPFYLTGFSGMMGRDVSTENDSLGLYQTWRRDTMDRFLSIVVPEWTTLSLDDLVVAIEDRFHQHVKTVTDKTTSTTLPEKGLYSNQWFFIQTIFVHLHQSPLPLRTEIWHSFVKTHPFQYPHGEVRFVREQGLLELEEALRQGHTDRIQTLQALLQTRGRHFRKIRTLSTDQLLQMCIEYRTKPLDLRTILEHLITPARIKYLQDHRLLSQLPLDGSSPLKEIPLPAKSKSTVKKTPLKLNTTTASVRGEKSLLYMIIRPWLPKPIRQTWISGSSEALALYAERAHDTDTLWYTPNASFFHDSCSSSVTQKGFLFCLRDDTVAVRLRFEYMDGSLEDQDELLFACEQRYFRDHPMYSTSFLIKATTDIRLALLNPALLNVLLRYIYSILHDAFACVLPGERYDLDCITQFVRDAIMEQTDTLSSVVRRVFSIVERLDARWSPLAVLHKTHHRRIQECVYEWPFILESFMKDDIAFPEQKDLVGTVNVSAFQTIRSNAFEQFQFLFMNRFRMRLYPTTKIVTSVAPPIHDGNAMATEVLGIPIVDVERFIETSTSTHSLFWIVRNNEWVDIRTLDTEDEIWNTFDMVRVFTWGQGLEMGLWEWPDYIRPTTTVVDPSLTTTPTHEDDPTFYPPLWDLWETFMKHHEALPVRTTPLLFQEQDHSDDPRPSSSSFVEDHVSDIDDNVDEEEHSQSLEE